MKRYIEIGEFERHTSHCPMYIAWQILEEARDYFRADISGEYATKLARRAEAVFAKNPFWQRKYRSARGREYLLSGMRHWLAAALAKEKPALFRQLPDSFKNGRPLPRRPTALEKRTCQKPRPALAARRIFHGWELLLT